MVKGKTSKMKSYKRAIEQPQKIFSLKPRAKGIAI
jgi:hypothetical protein